MWQITPAGDRGLLVTVGRTIDPSLLGQVLSLDQALAERRPSGLLSTVPAYASLLCHYDPDVTDAGRLEASIRQYDGQLDPSNLTLRDIEQIQSVFVKMLSATFHGRIAYPNLPKPEIETICVEATDVDHLRAAVLVSTVSGSPPDPPPPLQDADLFAQFSDDPGADRPVAARGKGNIAN